MLTRIEIDGFKSFRDFKLDLFPFTAILGTNASGKSNLFDALRFLSLLAVGNLPSAFQGVRGEPALLFHQGCDPSADAELRFAVETFLDPGVTDPWGKKVDISQRRLRYEVHVALQKSRQKMIVTHERAVAILRKDDRWQFAEQAHSVRQQRRTPYLDTIIDAGQTTFKTHQDGVAGRTRQAPAAESTVLSSIGNADNPHLFALREEMKSWRVLQLDPAQLRTPSSFFTSDEQLLPDGANMAAVLFRIQEETRAPGRPQGYLPEIAARLSHVIPGVTGIEVERVEEAREFRVFIRFRGGQRYPASVVSDGTLRVLALYILLVDPRHRGLLCFEEPENGIHPARLRALIEDLVGETSDLSSDGSPLRQLMVNSHSPVVLSALRALNRNASRCRLFFADMVSRTEPGTRPDVVSRMREVGATDCLPHVPNEQDSGKVRFVEVTDYLDTVEHEG